MLFSACILLIVTFLDLLLASKFEMLTRQNTETMKFEFKPKKITPLLFLFPSVLCLRQMVEGSPSILSVWEGALISIARLSEQDNVALKRGLVHSGG